MGCDGAEGVGGDLCQKSGESSFVLFGEGEVATEFVGGVVVATPVCCLFKHVIINNEALLEFDDAVLSSTR